MAIDICRIGMSPHQRFQERSICGACSNFHIAHNGHELLVERQSHVPSRHGSSAAPEQDGCERWHQGKEQPESGKVNLCNCGCDEFPQLDISKSA
jgi:hypothetical protein